MIFSKLNGGDDLSAYPAAIQRALAYLRDTDIMSLELGRHAKAAGADAISLINTIRGMRIDVNTRRPILKNNVGGMSGPAVAHHLKLLKGSGLIVSRRDGREMLYRLGDTEECREIHRSIDALFHVRCPGFCHKD